MRIGVDAMGGDHAPSEQVAGALQSREFLTDDDRVVLFGKASQVCPLLDQAGSWKDVIEVVDCPDAVEMDEPPVEALRNKPDSSIARLSRAHRSGEVDSIISAGNTGAVVAACQMHLRRLRGVHRPGICILVPTVHGPVALCDVGANVSCRPQHLFQYGVMAKIYAEHVGGVTNARIGLLSIGAEEGKGNALVKGTRDLFKEHNGLHFVGNVEGRDLFRGVCDVAVCEGFVGNVCLKLVEGLAEGLFKTLAKEIQAGGDSFAQQARKVFEPILARYDYNEHGGAPLLGVNGICVICHGSSNARAIRNAIRMTMQFSRQGVNELITAQLGEDSGTSE